MKNEYKQYKWCDNCTKRDGDIDCSGCIHYRKNGSFFVLDSKMKVPPNFEIQKLRLANADIETITNMLSKYYSHCSECPAYKDCEACNGDRAQGYRTVSCEVVLRNWLEAESDREEWLE